MCNERIFGGGVTLSVNAESILGDVNGDGECSLYDAIYIGKFLIENMEFTDEQIEVADFDGNGEVNLHDCIDICKSLARAISVPSSENNEFVEVSGAGIAVGNVETVVGSEIEVPLTLSGGIDSYGCVIEVTYDDGLTLTGMDYAMVSDKETGRAVYASITEMKTEFGLLTFECPDKAGEYRVDVNIYALDYNGDSFVSNPVATSGTITVASAEPTYDYLTYEKIDEDNDGTYDYVEVTGCDESVTDLEVPSKIEGLPVECIKYVGNVYYCKNISIPDSVKNIWLSSAASEGIPELENISVSENNNYYSSIDGVLFNKAQTKLIKFPAKNATEYVIPDSVTHIGSCAFSGNLESLTIPDSVKVMEMCAFHTARVENVYISDLTNWCNMEVSPDCAWSVPLSGANLYVNGELITELVIPEGVTSVKACSFNGCGSIESVIIPEHVEIIGDLSLSYCENLKSITIENPDCEIYDSDETILDYTTIYGYLGSTAQAYAEKYDREFVSLDEPRGDISGNGSIDLYDAIEIAKYMIGARDFTEEEMAIADFDGDTVVGLYDAIGIAKYILNS